MASMTFDEIVELVDQLTPQEQTKLTTYLLELVRERQLTKEERKALLRASILNVPVAHTPSPRREDWYDDDGR
jgi:hypothetical protein